MNGVHINIGTEKCCFFVPMSLLLINNLKKYRFLFYAVEEAMECSKHNYYSIGIIVFSQLFNLMKKKTPQERHKVAHEILRSQPSKDVFERITKEFLRVAEEIQSQEMKKYQSGVVYADKLFLEWGNLCEILTSTSK